MGRASLEEGKDTKSPGYPWPFDYLASKNAAPFIVPFRRHVVYNLYLVNVISHP